jgi:hypothetical protein
MCSQSGARLSANLLLSAQWAITVRDGALALKGSQLMGGQVVFSKMPPRRELTFGRFHLAGQYL